MERVSFNNLNNPYTLPAVRRNSENKQKQSYQASSGIYPIYNQVPYGIVKKNYVKIAETKLPTGELTYIYKLINGQIISIVQKPDGCPVVSTTFNVGAYDESKGKEGISHLIEHSMYHSSSKYSDVNLAIKELGAYSNAGTSINSTNYYIKLSDNNIKNLEKALDIQADMLFHPKFSKVEEKEKAIVIKEVKESEADEYGTLLDLCGKNLFSINKPDIKSSTAGSEKSVKSITVDDMFQYHKNYYIPSNCSTSIIAPNNPDEVIEIASKKFLEATKDIQNHPIQRKQYGTPNIITRGDLISRIESLKKSTLGFRIPVKSLKDKITLMAISQLLLERNHFATLAHKHYTDNYVFYVIDDSTDEYSFFEKFKEAISDLKVNPATNTEFKKIGKDVLDDIKKDFLTNVDLGESLSNDILDGQYDYEAIQTILNNLSNNDISEMLDKFDISKATIAVLHPKNTTQKELDEELERYRNYITPFQIPKNTVRLNVLNDMEEYNIQPYSAYPVKSTVLPDNTRFTVVKNSKTDNCRIIWEIYKPDLNISNPTAKLMLDYLSGGLNLEETLMNREKGIYLNADYSEYNKVVLNLTCKKEDLKESLKKVKKALEVDFDERNFKNYKQDVINKIKSSDADTAFSCFLAEKYGINLLEDKDELVKYLDKLTLNDVKSCYNALYSNSYSTLCALVPYEDDLGIINDIASEINIPNFAFKKENGGKVKKVYNPNPAPKCYAKEKNQPKYGLLYSYKTNRNISDSLKFKILGAILSKRIFDTLREKYQLGYQAGAVTDEYDDMGTIRPFIVTDHKDKKTTDMIYGQFKDIVKDLSSKPVTLDELKEAKVNLKMKYYDLEESVYDPYSETTDVLDEITSFLRVPYGLNQMQNNFEIIDSITTNDILKTAQYAFKNKPDCLAEADKETLDKIKEYYKSWI